ncbi:MAG: hypothetical protein JST82_00740 [Bacteroidetes bacterium]|nr:hypothetical protein [Bacteroidota bacterium]
MQKIAIILFLSIYSMGTLLCPLGDFSFLANLSGMYDLCKEEDHDIDAVDFVFEHLLNLEDVSEQFEEHDSNEKPHQPFQFSHTISQVVITIGKPLQIEFQKPCPAPCTKTSFPLLNDHFLQNNFLSQVFHPPIV